MGSYPIQQGTLKLSSNYNLTYLGANLTITKTNAASIIASSVSSSVYGQVVYVNVQIYSPSGVGTPTGTVVLVDGDGNHVLGQATLSGLIASFHVSTLGLGGHAIPGCLLGRWIVQLGDHGCCHGDGQSGLHDDLDRLSAKW